MMNFPYQPEQLTAECNKHVTSGKVLNNAWVVSFESGHSAQRVSGQNMIIRLVYGA
jgi:hypothetical protein